MTVGIIGAGFVGAACAKAMMLRGSCDVICLNDIDERKARGLANDLSHGSLLCPPMTIEAASIERMARAKVVVVTAGINERTGGAIDRSDPRGRLLLLPQNTEIYSDIIPRVRKAAPNAIILVVTDPPDALADVARAFAPKQLVLSTGTLLDSLRFRFQIARHLDVHWSKVEAEVLGEHGTSQVYAWSRVRIKKRLLTALAAGKGPKFADLKEKVQSAVKFANIEIIEGIGASQHGIGVVTARIVEAITRGKVLRAPIGTFRPDFGVTLSLPSILGRNGVVRVTTPKLIQFVTDALQRSAGVLRDALAGVSHCLPT